MYFRIMLSRSIALPASRSCLLLGPRQTGKSTLVRAQLPPDAWTVDLLDRETELRFARDPAQFARELHAARARGASTVFVDEVQKLPALLDTVHQQIESHGTRFILTGSSARKLRRGGANLLAGRATILHLHPLTRAEAGDLFDLERTLRFGSLPAVVTADDETARDLLEGYAQTYLREEIQAESLVRNLGGFARFMDIVAAQCGEIVNMSAVARDASLATRTVQEYFQILEDTLIGFRLEAWRKSPRARLVAHPKLYLFDTGVTNTLNRRLTAHYDRAQVGRLFEQWIVLECRRLLDYAREEARLFFWRTSAGSEVDLLLEKHGRLRLALEIKSGRVSREELTGLRTFADAHPGVPTVVVAREPSEYRIGEIQVLPYETFLSRFPGEWTTG